MKVRVKDDRIGGAFEPGEVLEVLEFCPDYGYKVKPGRWKTLAAQFFGADRFDVVEDMPITKAETASAEDPSAERDHQHEPMRRMPPTPYDRFPDLADWEISVGTQAQPAEPKHPLQRFK